MQNDQIKFREVYSKLPPEVQEAISSEKTEDALYNISNKYNLHIDQAGVVSKTALLLMLGILKPQDFVNKLSEGLKMPVDKVRPIAMEVNEQIFKPVRESLKKIHQLNEGGGGSIMENSIDSASSAPITKSPNFDDRLNKYLSSTPNEAKNSNPTPIYTQDPYREPAN